MKLLELIKANYNTYKNLPTGKSERHLGRLGVSFFISLLLAVFSTDAVFVYPIMVTGITILTGFAFAALFSNHIMADVGLSKPMDESDRMDLLRLASLYDNFKARSSYFIALSIIDSVLLIVASLTFVIPKGISANFNSFVSFIRSNSDLDVTKFLQILPSDFSDVFFVIVTFLFLECLYTFFRLSETIVAILDTRSKYMKAAEERS